MDTSIASARSAICLSGMGRSNQPPDTGGSTATSSVSRTASPGSAGSPFSQTFEPASTAANCSPYRAEAAASTPATSVPGTSSRPAAGCLSSSGEEAKHGHRAHDSYGASVAHHGGPEPRSAPWMLVVRHGQTTWNASKRWQGRADSPLSALGVAQARWAAETLEPFDVVVTSTCRGYTTPARSSPRRSAPRSSSIPTWRSATSASGRVSTFDEIEDGLARLPRGRRAPERMGVGR